MTLRLNMIIEATREGERRRFKVVEKANVGGGWMLLPFPTTRTSKVVHSAELTDIAEVAA